jgi:carboxylesterase
MARVLCLHGLGGTGATMWPVVAALSAADHTVLAPTLPGHGGESDDLIGVDWETWLAAAREWPADEPADIVVGQSMGALLAFALAAEGRAGAVVAINPPAPDPDAIDGLEWRQSRGHDWVEVGQSALGEAAYERLPIGALLAMHAGAMSVPFDRIVVPVLIVTSELDDVVDPASSDVVAAALGGPVQRLRLARGGHVATLDADRDSLAAAIVTFASRRA